MEIAEDSVTEEVEDEVKKVEVKVEKFKEAKETDDGCEIVNENFLSFLGEWSSNESFWFEVSSLEVWAEWAKSVWEDDLINVCFSIAAVKHLLNLIRFSGLEEAIDLVIEIRR